MTMTNLQNITFCHRQLAVLEQKMVDNIPADPLVQNIFAQLRDSYTTALLAYESELMELDFPIGGQV